MNYFSYGQSMDNEKMREWDVEFSGRNRARLLGYRLEFNKISLENPDEGYANIVQFENGIVEGLLYEIREEDLSKLDEHEGCPDQFERIEVEVLSDSWQRVKAFTYGARPDKVKSGLKPTMEHIGHLLAAGNLLSESYRRKLSVWETLDR
ncbi:MAG: gamma-glutamylcyclotransferase [Deltaproteobacteria bacterium]|nr:gamma-glutamylcyclotransferase [Deltaproteobacteria bacterium]MBW2076450.1 gamma-glutamylcyclotransferase [Deltaproteobacteria bacterium]MBW2310056.1 gamma-glutamylcyclotransferase [Deltaproteobacteria bacterium]RLB31308.1 MAG: gamma-glutamylcyclotransferase [Deltaproteobacteria bacterium]